MQFSGDVLSSMEAESLIRQLKPIPIEEIGNDEWKAQRVAMEKLNMCTHSNAVQKKDDFVKQYLIDHEKVLVLLHELLVMEVWRQRVLPQVLDAMADNPAAPYMYVSYEAVLINLLECLCYYEEVVVAFSDDVLELVDYCWRQVYRLFSLPNVNAVRPEPTTDALQKMTAADHMRRQLEEGLAMRAMGCISILWFVIDRLGQLPLAAMNHILQKNDLPVGLSEVLLLQPWVRRGPPNVCQKYRNSTFETVTGDEVLRVCTPEAHTWFCLHKLLTDVECRRQYQYTKHKKDAILQIRRFFNDTLLDQIPALESVQRALEELSFMEPPTGTEEKFKSKLVIEQVPRIRTSIDNASKDWKRQSERMQRLLSDRTEKGKMP
ncbi:hypothetical protein STCU_05701 [Strigomonas culicis]|uniref:Zinc finger, MYND-type containing 10 n=1 Tax=Strigomonas culicis TaxID=28005 RepID=S9U9W5_9TRYP|nr:hypothetical protein STCU_05701 [Strigomonas culicis]|eukprot:EPY27537.1 hypothetical protein STCU_05701 [Strigomonas culicis]